jgi:hypothetical protein
MGVDNKDDQTDVNPNQKDGDEILRRMLKAPRDPKKKLAESANAVGRSQRDVKKDDR